MMNTNTQTYIYIRTVLRIWLVENINILDDTVMNGKTIFPWWEFHYDS